MINRSITTRALKWRYSGDKVDALSFSVSKDVSLTAVGICRPHNQGGQMIVRRCAVIDGKSVDARPMFEHKERTEVQYHPSSSVHKMTLSSSVALKKGRIYTVVFLIQGDSSFKCVDCSDCCSDGDLVCKFMASEFSGQLQSNHTDSVCGPLASFYFI